MTQVNQTKAWLALADHYQQVQGVHMRDLFQQDPLRFKKFSLNLGDILFDFSKNRITGTTLSLLLDLANQSMLSERIKAMFSGEKINLTEDRAVLHIALRNQSRRPIDVDGKDVMIEVREVLVKMRTFSEAVRSGEWKGYSGKAIKDIVNIGIGGSDLGPKMVCQALKPYANPGLNVHFVSNVDSSDLVETLRHL